MRARELSETQQNKAVAELFYLRQSKGCVSTPEREEERQEGAEQTRGWEKAGQLCQAQVPL